MSASSGPGDPLRVSTALSCSKPVTLAECFCLEAGPGPADSTQGKRFMAALRPGLGKWVSVAMTWSSVGHSPKAVPTAPRSGGLESPRERWGRGGWCGTHLSQVSDQTPPYLMVHSDRDTHFDFRSTLKKQSEPIFGWDFCITGS